MKKYIIATLMVLGILGMGLSAAYNEPIFLNSKYGTKDVTVTALYRDGSAIKYEIREKPVGTQTQGKKLDTFWARGAHNIQPFMEKWAVSNKVNVNWTYNHKVQESGRFSTKATDQVGR